MADIHGQFDTSDISEPGGLEPLENSVSQESAETLEEMEALAASEGLEKVHEMFKKKVDDESALFSTETARVAKSIETRYEMTMNTGETAELQELMQQEEELHARVKTDMVAVVEDRYTPHPEQVSEHAQLRETRRALDTQWETLSEIVALEGADESEMMKYALKSGQDLPPMTDAGKRLNEVLREIFAIDQKLAELPQQKPAVETPRATPPPPPGGEGRAEHLFGKASEEMDPAKKAELAMQALDEKHGSTETPPEKEKEKESSKKHTEWIIPEGLGELAEEVMRNTKKHEETEEKEWKAREDEARELLAEDKKLEQPPKPIKAEVQAPVTEEKPTEGGDKASDEELMSFVADKKEEPTEAVKVQKSPEDSRESILDLMETSVFLGKLGSLEMEARIQKWISDFQSGSLDARENPATQITQLKYEGENFASKESFITFLQRNSVTHPDLEIIAESFASLPASDIESILEGYRTVVEDNIELLASAEVAPEADLQSAAVSEIAEVIAEDDNPEAPVTHSERHAMNAETFGNLVTDLKTHLDTLQTQEIDFAKIKTSDELLEALGKAGVLSDEEVSGFDGDHMRKNVLLTKFKKLKGKKK